MRIFIALNLVLPLLAFRTENNCLEMPKSSHISSICTTALGPDALQLKVYLTDPANVGKAELQCENEDTDEGRGEFRFLNFKALRVLYANKYTLVGG